MFDVFGAEMPLAVRFFLAFLIVLGLIGAAAWAVRRFGSGRLGGTGLRGRQPRLSVIERTSVDARRWLYLVRRDNVEHLLLIGGPTDVVVEPNIVRASPAAREVTMARPPAATETLPRAIPLPEHASNGSWPLQPEPAMPPPPPRRPSRAEPIAEELGSPPPPPEKPRPQREALAALAEDLASSPLPPPPPPPAPPASRAPAAVRPHPVEAPAIEPRAERRPEPRPEQRAEPRVPAQSTSAEAAAAADKTLAEMAQRLEAALRKTKPAESRETGVAPAAAPAAPAVEPAPEVETASATPPPPPAPPPSAPPTPPRAVRPAETKPARPDLKTKEGKALYESLEQEMASLLGRQAGKT